MAVQNISGSDVMPTGFSPEYTRAAETVERRPEETEKPPERPPEEGRGGNIDVTA